MLITPVTVAVIACGVLGPASPVVAAQAMGSGRAGEGGSHMSALDFVLMEKRIVGSLFGTANPRRDIPKMLDLYHNGALKLDELATHTYKLDDINTGYQDMREGRNLCGVITF